MKYLVLAFAIFLSGCTAVTETSFYDDNESMLIVNVRYAVETLNCDYVTNRVHKDILKLKLYSESKRSVDLYKLVDKMSKTAEGIEPGMKSAVCKVKKKILQKQSKDIANAAMRRW
jgi:hypothetical protein